MQRRRLRRFYRATLKPVSIQRRPRFGAPRSNRALAGSRPAYILSRLELWRVRLVVRTQPSQGWCTGSTPVRAAILNGQAVVKDDLNLGTGDLAAAAEGNFVRDHLAGHTRPATYTYCPVISH
jgi:hypothetical protein